MAGDENRRGDPTPGKFMRANGPRVYRKIEQVNPKLNAVVQLCFDRAIAEACVAD
jgi:hypothetical protein